ncbi:MAG TPA: MFS transporter [Anaerolineales bacterium]|nr:MFS transporter [Anaerolineales bacterium]
MAAAEEDTSSIKALPRNVWVVTVTSFLTDISSEMIFNLIPLFLANVLGVGTAIIGLIDGIAETTASLTKIYAGALSDQLGRRKLLAVIGYGLSAFSKPFLYFAETWGWVLGVRFSDRVGKGIRTAPRDALVADSIDEKQRGLAFGIHRAGDTAGAFVGLGLAALIVWLTQGGAVELTRHTFQVTVLVSIVPAILAVVVLAYGAHDIPGTRKSTGRLQLTLEGLDTRFKLFLLVVILFTLGNSSDSFIVLLGQNRGLDVLQVMLMVMTFNLVYASLSGPFGSLSDRLGRRTLIIAGWIVYGLIYLGLALSHTGLQVWVLFALYGIYYAATDGVARALVADYVPQERRGGAYGLYNGAVGITALPASVIAGLLWQGVGSWPGLGPSAPFIFGAVMALLAGILFWRLVR